MCNHRYTMTVHFPSYFVWISLAGGAILDTLAKGAARKHGVIDYKGLLARLHRNIGVEI